MIPKIRDLIHCDFYPGNDGVYELIFNAGPAKGWMYVTIDSPSYFSGEARMRAEGDGKYPTPCLPMIEHMFGPEDNVIEVCSHNTKYPEADVVTVDINRHHKPDYVDDGQVLSRIESNRFNRWRCDPPYTDEAARKKYGNKKKPEPFKLLKAGARVCKPGSLMFLLLNRIQQECPAGVKRIGRISISMIPMPEERTLNIYYKEY